VAQQVCDQ